jgi:predicted DsbA family dithiol-disulfide isomerase
MAVHVLRVDIVSDVICPWCALGWSRLRAAAAQVLAAEPDVRFEVVWRPWLLAPRLERLGEAGTSKTTGYIKKFGAEEFSMYARQMTTLGLQERPAIHFDFSSSAMTGGTLDAHRLMVLAAEARWRDADELAFADLASCLAQRLFDAFHQRGRSPSDRSLLRACASEAAADARLGAERSRMFVEAAGRWLAEEDRGRQQVTTDIEQARKNGVTGVPHFFVAAEVESPSRGAAAPAVFIPGAQDTETFVLVLRQRLRKARERAASKL